MKLVDGWTARKHAVADLLTEAPLHIFAEVVYVIFALAETNVEHEFALGRVLKKVNPAPARIDSDRVLVARR